MSTSHVRTTTPHLTIDGRTYEPGSVVEVDHYRRKALVEHGHAVDVDGPDAPAEGTDPPAGRSRKAEKATRI